MFYKIYPVVNGSALKLVSFSVSYLPKVLIGSKSFNLLVNYIHNYVVVLGILTLIILITLYTADLPRILRHVLTMLMQK